MIAYQYKARDKAGSLIKGTMGAESENAVASKLKEFGYMPISIKATKKADFIEKLVSKFKRVSFSDVNMFTHQFYALQRAGLPLLSSLSALKEQSVNMAFRDALSQITRDIEAGSNLANALFKHPKIFNSLYVNMIKSAEVSGRLDEALERLATLGEHEEKVRLRIKAASRYPLMVVFAIIIGFLILTTFVMPRFAKVFGQYNTQLPLPTLILLGVNYVIRNFWWLIIFLAAGVVLAFNKFINTYKGRLLWDGLKLKVPVFGPLILKLTMSRFTRVTGTLLKSGVPVLQILELTAASVGNVVVANTINNIRKSVGEGRGILEPMKVSGMFPPVVIEMVAVGEETGKLDELLLHVSDYYDSQIDYTVSNLVSLIEPFLIFVLGLATLLMALGIFLPMWNLMNLFKK